MNKFNKNYLGHNFEHIPIENTEYTGLIWYYCTCCNCAIVTIYSLDEIIYKQINIMEGIYILKITCEENIIKGIIE